MFIGKFHQSRSMRRADTCNGMKASIKFEVFHRNQSRSGSNYPGGGIVGFPAALANVFPLEVDLTRLVRRFKRMRMRAKVCDEVDEDPHLPLD